MQSGLSPTVRFMDVFIWVCPRCGLGKTALEREAYDWQAVNNGYYDSDATADYVSRIQSPQETERSLDVAHWICSRIRRGATPGKYLDVGCSSGSMLRAFESMGWDVWGIEPTNAIVAVPEHLKHRTSRCCFGEETIDPHFDLITAFHVLEHIPQPAVFLRHCRDMLKRGGFVVLEVPDFSFARRWLEKEGPAVEPQLRAHISPGLHVHQFTLESLALFVKHAGLDIVWQGLVAPAIRLSCITPTDDGLDKHGTSEAGINIVPQCGGTKRAGLSSAIKRVIWKSRWARITVRDFCANTLGFGRHATIIARRPAQ